MALNVNLYFLESQVSGLSVDGSAGLLFYTINSEQSVILMDLSTKKEHIIIKNGDLGPRAIRCDPVARYFLNDNLANW